MNHPNPSVTTESIILQQTLDASVHIDRYLSNQNPNNDNDNDDIAHLFSTVSSIADRTVQNFRSLYDHHHHHNHNENEKDNEVFRKTYMEEITKAFATELDELRHGGGTPMDGPPFPHTQTTKTTHKTTKQSTTTANTKKQDGTTMKVDPNETKEEEEKKGYDNNESILQQENILLPDTTTNHHNSTESNPVEIDVDVLIRILYSGSNVWTNEEKRLMVSMNDEHDGTFVREVGEEGPDGDETMMMEEQEEEEEEECWNDTTMTPHERRRRFLFG